MRTADGSFTLAHPGHGQTCHSSAGAWLEARERYARPCRLRELGTARGRVRLLDVGTGIGLNLAAALEALEGTGAVLEVVTLERDTEVIRAGLRLPTGEPELERWFAPVRAALERALAEPTRVEPLFGGTLELVLGDARRRLPQLDPERRFDAVFLDPFSPRVESQLWEVEFLAEVARRMSPGALLSTYSSSMAVRVALVLAGLELGRGPRVGDKASGTLAGPAASLPHLPALDERTVRRLAARVAGKAAPAGVDRPRNCLESK